MSIHSGAQVFHAGYLFVMKRSKLADTLSMSLENAQVSSHFMRALRILSPDTPFGHLKYLAIPFAVDAIGVITAVSMACQSIRVEPFFSVNCMG